jgi:hypothetical protein
MLIVKAIGDMRWREELELAGGSEEAGSEETVPTVVLQGDRQAVERMGKYMYQDVEPLLRETQVVIETQSQRGYR